MVENRIETRGTVNKIIFNIVRIPFELVSSNENTDQENNANKIV